MKKHFLLFVILLAGSITAASAQDTYFGIRGGANFSNIIGDGITDEADFVLRYHGGVYAHIGIAEKFGIQPELLYSAKGTEFEEGNIEVQYKNSYIEMPILFVHTTEGSQSVQIFAGPSIGYMVSDKIEANGTTSEVKTYTEDIGEFNDFEIGLQGGFGYQFDAGLNIGLRGAYGLSKIFDNDSELHNLSFMLTVGYAFGKD